MNQAGQMELTRAYTLILSHRNISRDNACTGMLNSKHTRARTTSFFVVL